MSSNRYKKCPPVIICFENVTLVLIFIFLFVTGYMVYASTIKNTSSPTVVINEKRPATAIFAGSPNYPYNNYPVNDVYSNPYTPPLSDERYFIPRRVPINVSTNIGAVDTAYRQMGILTPHNGSGKILPLMGRPLFVNRYKWQYYTMSDQFNSIKLPVSSGGRSCTGDNGCDQLYSGDSVYVEGYNEAFKATIYDTDTIKYIPFL